MEIINFDFNSSGTFFYFVVEYFQTEISDYDVKLMPDTRKNTVELLGKLSDAKRASELEFARMMAIRLLVEKFTKPLRYIEKVGDTDLYVQNFFLVED